MRRRRTDPEQPETGHDRPQMATPVLLGLGGIAGGSALTALGLFFLKTGALVFGSGLAIVPFMRSGVVDQHHWLTNNQFLDAVAMGLITPGPVVISAGFIGYLIAGLPGALVSSIAIFTPIYLGVVIPGRWFLRHRDNPQLRAFVAGATAAAAGALCGAVVVLTRQAIINAATASIAIVTLALLWRFKVKETYIVIAAGAVGILLH
jgi:chromate transporter